MTYPKRWPTGPDGHLRPMSDTELADYLAPFHQMCAEQHEMIIQAQVQANRAALHPVRTEPTFWNKLRLAIRAYGNTGRRHGRHFPHTGRHVGRHGYREARRGFIRHKPHGEL